jgi:hypothetical protein
VVCLHMQKQCNNLAHNQGWLLRTDFSLLGCAVHVHIHAWWKEV